MDKQCNGQHDIYVAEVFYILAEGNAVVVTVCRACNLVKFHTQQIAQPNAIVEMLKSKENV